MAFDDFAASMVMVLVFIGSALLVAWSVVAGIVLWIALSGYLAFRIVSNSTGSTTVTSGRADMPLFMVLLWILLFALLFWSDLIFNSIRENESLYDVLQNGILILVLCTVGFAIVCFPTEFCKCPACNYRDWQPQVVVDHYFSEHGREINVRMVREPRSRFPMLRAILWIEPHPNNFDIHEVAQDKPGEKEA